MKKYNVAELLKKKKQFYRMVPSHMPMYQPFPQISKEGLKGDGDSKLPLITRIKVSQDQFLKEMNPQTHLIYDRNYYPDKEVTSSGRPPSEDPDAEVYIKEVARVSLPFQDTIARKARTHLFGNHIEFDLYMGEDDTFTKFKKAWGFNRMKDICSLVAESVFSTGDGAAFFKIDKKGRVKREIWSYKFGNSLAMHKDCFTRYFKEDKKEHVWVIDDSNVGKYERGDDGWEYKSYEAHGFTQIPVAYQMIDDIPSGVVQPLIDRLERSLSNLCESNERFGLSMLFLKGGDVEVMPNMSAQNIILQGGADSEASLIEGQGKAGSFTAEIEMLDKQIYKGSGTSFINPEDINGDPSGTFVKMMYGDSVQRAMENAPLWSEFIQTLIDINTEAAGIAHKNAYDFADLEVEYRVKPYIPQSDAEITQNLMYGVQSKFISKDTASEISSYGSADEMKKIEKEAIDEINLENYNENEL